MLHYHLIVAVCHMLNSECLYRSQLSPDHVVDTHKGTVYFLHGA